MLIAHILSATKHKNCGNSCWQHVRAAKMHIVAFSTLILGESVACIVRGNCENRNSYQVAQ